MNVIQFQRTFQDWRPKIVCLCGSTKFYDTFIRANYDETMKGNIVLSVGFFMHSSEAFHGQTFGCTPEQKIGLDDLHKRKIDLCDEVLVLNKDGYLGTSTMSEIEYARGAGKIIRYLEKNGVEFPKPEINNAHTYCMNRVNGRLCQTTIGVNEEFCARCKQLIKDTEAYKLERK